MPHLYLIDEVFFSNQEKLFNVKIESGSEIEKQSNTNTHSNDTLLTIRSRNTTSPITCIGLRRKNEGDTNNLLPKNNLLEAVASLLFLDLKRGDIVSIILEVQDIQRGLPNMPVIVNEIVYKCLEELIRDKGVIVILAAGNQKIDIDFLSIHPFIMVGSKTEGSDSSNFGSVVNLYMETPIQLKLGESDAVRFFDNSSAATALVTALALNIQEKQSKESRKLLNQSQMKELLMKKLKTGTSVQ